MKILEQVESRTPISWLPFPIRDPGSYYLTADLTGAISRDGTTIDADDVTIDLNGYSLRGVAGSRSGILILGSQRNITVQNGVIRDWDLYEIDGDTASHSRFRDIVVSNNGTGVGRGGLRTSADCLVEGCQAHNNAGDGISLGDRGQVRNCLAEQNTSIGIKARVGCQVSESVSSGNSTGIETGERCTVTRCSAAASLVHGIVAGAGSHVQECAASSNSQIGIALLDGATVLDSTSTANSTDGIQVTNRCVVRNNTCSDNGFAFFGAGVRLTGDENRVEGNQLTGADRGLWITGTSNHVAGNTVRANTENYVISAGNHLILLLSEIPETIAWPATVELAGTLTGITSAHGITVNSSDVTIDLKGHSLVGVPGSLNGINVISTSPRHTGLVVRNGTVRQWEGHGLNAEYCSAGSLAGLTARNNGLSGITASRTAVDIPVAWHLVEWGALENGAEGFDLGSHCLVLRCNGSKNTTHGIRVTSESTIKDCVANDNGEHGIRAQNDCRIIGNTCDDNTMDGIRLTNGDNRVDGNHVTDNDVNGIHASAPGNLVIRNTAADKTTNYLFVASNRHGPIVNVAAVNGDISGTVGSDHPWANFEFCRWPPGLLRCFRHGRQRLRMERADHRPQGQPRAARQRQGGTTHRRRLVCP